MKAYIRNLLIESIDMAVVEGLLDEDYPTSWDIEKFKSLNNFAKRVKYCEENLQRISSGSARIVYKIDEEKVLKLAKNVKGLAQNEVEAQWGSDRYFSSILAQTFQYHQDNLWVEMQLAKKVNPNDFKRVEGPEFNFSDFGTYLKIQCEERKNKKSWISLTPEKLNYYNENSFTADVLDFMFNVDAPAGDMARLNSWGLVKRDGTDAIVMIDFGLTEDVYSTHYTPKGRPSYYQ